MYNSEIITLRRKIFFFSSQAYIYPRYFSVPFFFSKKKEKKTAWKADKPNYTNVPPKLRSFLFVINASLTTSINQSPPVPPPPANCRVQ